MKTFKEHAGNIGTLYYFSQHHGGGLELNLLRNFHDTSLEAVLPVCLQAILLEKHKPGKQFVCIMESLLYLELFPGDLLGYLG